MGSTDAIVALNKKSAVRMIAQRLLRSVFHDNHKPAILTERHHQPAIVANALPPPPLTVPPCPPFTPDTCHRQNWVAEAELSAATGARNPTENKCKPDRLTTFRTKPALCDSSLCALCPLWFTVRATCSIPDTKQQSGMGLAFFPQSTPRAQRKNCRGRIAGVSLVLALTTTHAIVSLQSLTLPNPPLHLRVRSAL